MAPPPEGPPPVPVQFRDPERQAQRDACRDAFAQRASMINASEGMLKNPVPKTMSKLGMQNNGGWFKKVDLRTVTGEQDAKEGTAKKQDDDETGLSGGPRYVKLAPDGLFDRLYGGEKRRVYEAKMLEARRAMKGSGGPEEDAVIQGVMAGLACEGGGAAKFLFGSDYSAGLAQPATGAKQPPAELVPGAPVKVANDKAGDELTRQLLEALGPAADGAASAPAATVAASAPAQAAEPPPDDGLAKLSVKELKRRMAEAGVDGTGLAEKSELVDALRKAGAGAAPPAKRPRADEPAAPAPAAPAPATGGAWL